MNLRSAMICMDCDEIGLEATHCMVCGSRQVTPLAKWIPPRDKILTDIEINARVAALLGECHDMQGRIHTMMSDVDNEPIGAC